MTREQMEKATEINKKLIDLVEKKIKAEKFNTSNNTYTLSYCSGCNNLHITGKIAKIAKILMLQEIEEDIQKLEKDVLPNTVNTKPYTLV